MKLQIFLSLILSSLAANAADRPVSSFGEVQYVNLGEFMGGTGTLVLKGKAAKALFQDMTSGKHTPAAPNIEQLPPSQISLNLCESIYGDQIACKKIPEITEDGNSLKRDDDGNVVYGFQCFLSLQDVANGKIAPAR